MWSATLAGEDSSVRQRASAAKVSTAVEKQLAATQRQVGTPSESFFTTPWLQGPAVMSPTAAMTGGPMMAAQADCDPVGEGQLQTLITDAAQKEGIDPLLIRAVIRRESAAKPCAVSEKGAQGLMQIIPATQQYLGITNPFDPAENIAGGARYLKEMLNRYKGDTKLALAAYNAGPHRVDAGGRVPGIPETQAYVAAIMADLAKVEEPAPLPF